MQVPILSGIYADAVADWRTAYPRNMIPVPKSTGISDGCLRPADGIDLFATGPGTDRGGFNWNGVLHRVMGTKLCRVSSAGVVTVLGDVGAGGTARIDNGPDYLAIWSGTRLYFWDGGALTQVSDTDLGDVIDGCIIAGYALSTDGTYLIVNELTDRTQINPLKYGTAESDPDPILAVGELQNEAYAFGRYTIEVFENIGGTGFPFQRIEGAQVPRGAIGTRMVCAYADTFAFVGSGKNNGQGEAPAVYVMSPGAATRISTREIDQVLERYTEEQLALCLLEAKVDKGHNWLVMHLPDTSWVYDLNATKLVQQPVWFELNSAVVGLAQYRARNLVWVYDRWVSGDPTTAQLGTFNNTASEHYGAVTGWDFGTMVIYNASKGAILLDMELVAQPGRVAFGADPVVWVSHSLDGETWGQEHQIQAGKQGERLKRLARRMRVKLRNYMMLKFRGTSDCHVSFARLEANFEALNG